MKSDNAQYYGTISRALHWLMALCFTFMLGTAVAWNMNEEYFSLMNYHKAMGFLLMILVVVRVIWAIKNRHNRPTAGNILVKLGHGALYFLMILVPLVGLLRQYGSARGDLSIFGITLLPAAPEKIEWMNKLGGALHGEAAWVLFALAGGHILFAIAHQIRGEKIINRMAGPRK
ncbi:cytochrome b [Alysiella filiformis]|uniref:Cytochrome b561 n=1 Tax=Alysiella filiformis DSM 16848 TaxID=1120981 RepID=A0A286EBQ5_9NEIS|nr:cytochrome b [Alysiella filiformis]QMT31303.1 cytochrome b [Alysiella filiformis]UBQ55691.1 cytochrome b [Alysiella filiformis DSM 16848]SOD68318.1 cytochrome b561 [Alysiella filiformis DSM 16848]